MKTKNGLSKLTLITVVISLLSMFTSCGKDEEPKLQSSSEFGGISDLQVAQVKSASLWLSWDNPQTDNFDHVEIYYGIGSSAADATTFYTSTADDGGTYIEHLVADTQYVFLLRTVDTEGNKTAGITIIATTTDFANKMNISNLKVIPRNGRVILIWTPLEDKSNYMLTFYYNEGKTAAEPTTELSLPVIFGDSLVVVPELTNDKEYVFAVKTQTIIGFDLEESKGVMITATPREINEVLNPDLNYGSFTDSRDGEVYKTIQIGNQTWMAENFRYLPSVYPSTEGVGSNDESRYYVYGYEGSNIAAAKKHTEEVRGVDWNGDGIEYQNGSNKMTVNCYETYGVLYNKHAALNACPSGWHLPSDAEWKTLEMQLGMSASDANKHGQDRGKIAKKLAAQIGWMETNAKEHIGYNFYANNSSGFSALPGGSRHGGYSSHGGFGEIGYEAFYWTSTKEAAYTYYSRSIIGSDVIKQSSNNASGLSVRYIKD